MGTRADFYIGRGEQAEWLGSIAWDGYPSGLPKWVFQVGTEKGFRTAVKDFLHSREDATLPEQGWPWPWDDSRTTDYAYAFDEGVVHASCFGHKWFDPLGVEPEDDEGGKVAVFPDMKARKNVTMGERSGLIVFKG